MERPIKRMKMSRQDSRSLRDAGSRMKEGLFTSELDMQSDDTDAEQPLTPTRTLELSEMQRHVPLSPGQYRPPLYRRNAETQVVRRAPDATVTTSVVDVNVSVSGTSVYTTEIAQSTGDVAVSISSLGTLTVPGVTSSSATVDSNSSGSETVLTSPPTTPLPSSSSFSSFPLSTTPVPSSGTSTPGNYTTITSGTFTITQSSERTFTVTETSTFEVYFANGTFIIPAETAVATLTSQSSLSSGASGLFNTQTTSEASVESSTATASSSDFSTINVASTTSVASNTIISAGGAGASESATGTAPTSSSTSGSGSGGGLSPIQQQVVGGVVGGVAGVALVLLVALVFLRWYRKHLKSQGRLPEQQAASRNLQSSGGDSTNVMSQRSSNVPFAAAAAMLSRRFRPQSSHTMATTATGSTVPDSERGFQRIAGRKIAPVLSTGGDGFGGSYGAFEKDVGSGGEPSSSSPQDPSAGRGLAESSFYRDSGGFYGGKGSTPVTPTPVAHSRGESTARDFAEEGPVPTIAASRPEGFAVMRPSPARTPVTRSPSESSLKLPIQQGPSMEGGIPPTPPVPRGLARPSRDGIGRSLASQDGSRASRASASRFTESV